MTSIPGDALERVLQMVDERADEIVAFAGELIRQPSVNPDLEPNERGRAARPRSGCATSSRPPARSTRSTTGRSRANRPNVVAVRKGAGGGRSLIWSAHTDVVPVTPEQARAVGAAPDRSPARCGTASSGAAAPRT